MTRASKYWAAAIVLVVLGVALQRGFYLKRANSIGNDGPGKDAVARVSTRDLSRSDGAKGEPISVSLPSGADKPSGPAGQSLANSDTNEGKGTRQAFGTDRSVIGTPFSVSAAVTDRCRFDKIVCPLIYKKLAEFANEPRDNAWAAQEEANIQNHIESQGPDKYSIRNLECRTTICTVEVSSISDQYLGMPYYYMVKYSLSQDLGTGAYETDALGARVGVSLMTFTRWQHMCWNKPCDLSSMTPPP
jgi:hypothetical protein